MKIWTASAGYDSGQSYKNPERGFCRFRRYQFLGLFLFDFDLRMPHL